MNSNDPITLFRFSIIGSLITQELQQGELKRELDKLAQRTWFIPNSRRTRLSAKTIEGWYYRYQKQGLEGLAPKPRLDKGVSKLAPLLQQQIIAAKRENLKRSVRQLVRLMEERGSVLKGSLSPAPQYIVYCSSRVSQPFGVLNPNRKSIGLLKRRMPVISGMAMPCMAPKSCSTGDYAKPTSLAGWMTLPAWCLTVPSVWAKRLWM